jgi:hypothetical protein
MSITRLISQAKNKLFPPAPTSLSKFIEHNPHKFGYWLRPANALQSQQMVGAYLKANKDHLKNGGYIFVKKSRAAGLLQQLTELEVPYKAVHLKDMADLSQILDIDEPKALWIIVEDDSLPYATLASRFKVAEAALRSKMAPALGTPIESEEAMRKAEEKRLARVVTLVMFIEMDYPSMKGFSVIQAQCRSLRIASCRVSMDNAYDHELNKIFDEPEHSEAELKSRAANTVQIFGSGPKHLVEFTDTYRKRIELSGIGPFTKVSPESDSIDFRKLALESNLGLALEFGSGYAEILDISR